MYVANAPRSKELDGYVTTLSAVKGRGERELERALGFNANALGEGYCLYALAGKVEMHEFEWKDRTRYSGGWHDDPTIDFGPDKNRIWSVQRQDELRAALGKQYGYDEKATDRAIYGILAKALARLNVRTGRERIVKLFFPNSRPSHFPDAEFRDVPQWRLKVKKKFTLLPPIESA